MHNQATDDSEGTPWIVVSNTSEGGYELCCERCKQSYVPALPVTIPMFLAMAKEFSREHKKCQERQEQGQR